MTKKLLAILLAAAMLLSVPFVFSTAVAPVRRGDADRDGKISSGDARLALRASVGLEPLTADFMMRCDADANGKVESADARTILRTSVNLDSIDLNPCDHQAETWEPVALTGGVTADFHKGVCTKCGEAIFTDHEFEMVVTTPYTCTAPGEGYEKCACGLTKDPVSLPAQHRWEEVPGSRKDATCSEDGHVDWKCAVCGEEYSEKLPGGHVPNGEATCVKSQVCTRCGEVLAAAPGHKYKSGAAITLTKGIRCERCGKIGMPGFNDLVNALKDGTHTYSGFKVTTNSADKPKFTGLMELMINVMPKSEREQMLNEFAADETFYSVLVKDRAISDYDYNLIGENVVSRLAEGDVKSFQFEWVNGVDFLASLPSTYTNERNREESLAAFKSADIGPVAKVTLTFAPETNSHNGAISRIDSELAEIIEESSGDLGGMADEFNIFGEGSMKMDLKSTATLTVTYYFDAKTSAPIAAHYDDGVTIDSKMNLYINDEGEVTDKSTGAIAMHVATKMDSYYFFDDYFKS